MDNSNILIRIKYYADGYEKLVSISEYNNWIQTEETSSRKMFKVIGILINNNYISLIKENKNIITNKEEPF